MTISSLNVWSEQGVMYWYLQALFSFALSTSVIIFIDIVLYVISDLKRYNTLDQNYKQYDQESDNRYMYLLSDFRIYTIMIIFVFILSIPLSAIYGEESQKWSGILVSCLCAVVGIVLVVQWVKHKSKEEIKRILLKVGGKIAEWMFVALLCFTISAIFIVNNKATISVSYNADGIVEICNTSAENYNGLDIEIWNMDGEKIYTESVEKEKLLFTTLTIPYFKRKDEPMKQPILAICYDFDKTLSPDDMQAQGYIQSIDYEVADFWKESNKLASDNDMDQNLAYMYMMRDKSRGKVLFTKETLRKDGSKVQLFPGVRTWFDRINEYGKSKGVMVEHYIISSGLKEMIEGTEVADKFKKIYASSFYYNDVGEAVWPAQVVNYTNKTQFLFRIEKGVLDVNDQEVNSFFEPNQYRVPFRNMVYIGDSDTDIPCMKLVNINGGHSIGVYNSETKDKSKVFRMLDENRIKYYAPANYEKGSILEQLVQKIIDRTISNEVLEEFHFDCLLEKEDETRGQSEEELKKEELIDKLEDSGNFANTHAVIKQLSEINEWSLNQRNKLYKIALENTQVMYILKDTDVKEFYSMICNEDDSEDAMKVKEIIYEE